MRAACIVPISALPLIKDFSYHLALAHVALGSSTYASFYRTRTSSNFIILDNSAHELGRSLGYSLLTQAVELTNPDLLVVPDVLWDPEETLESAREFASVIPDFLGRQFMVVPQGQSAPELRQSLRDLLDVSYYANYVGLNKATARLKIRAELAKIAMGEGRKVHFLGAWKDPAAELLEGKDLGESVTGIDTSYVARLALLGRTLLEPFPTPPSLDFFTDEDAYDVDWLRNQLEAFCWLAEGPASTVAELEQEYKNGRF